jgi:8-oxo-dGTP pyrophosphatase MutT (NUDIX family)
MVAVTPMTVRAAGGVVWRPAGDGVEICLIHRPRYDDWSLPKGKLEKGEHPLVAAVREVGEETGARAVPQVRLPTVHYTVDGAPKTVDYWSMRYIAEDPAPMTGEADAVIWLPVGVAADRLSYGHDLDVVGAFAALPSVTAACVLIRHAHAGKRGTWPGPDDARPLDAQGWRHAEAVTLPAASIAPRRLVSATPVRCRQTLQPLATLLDLPIDADSAFDEPRPGQNPDENALVAAARLVELAAGVETFVVCSQGKVMPAALAHLTGSAAADHTTEKGDGWLLAFDRDRVVGADGFRLRDRRDVGPQ